MRVCMIGTAGPKQQERLRELGATPDRLPSMKMCPRAWELSPSDGVAAVFDHVGGPGHRRLVADARARRHARLLRHRRDEGHPGQPAAPGARCSPSWTVCRSCQTAPRDVLQPWKGARFRRDRFRARLREDLGQVPAAAGGRISRRSPPVRLEHRRRGALRFAEAGGFTGKVLLLP